jgi:hypothetical protein
VKEKENTIRNFLRTLLILSRDLKSPTSIIAILLPAAAAFSSE